MSVRSQHLQVALWRADGVAVERRIAGYFDIHVIIGGRRCYLCRRVSDWRNLESVRRIQRRWRDIHMRRVAVLMALHPRLGEKSDLGCLGRDLIQHIMTSPK